MKCIYGTVTVITLHFQKSPVSGNQRDFLLKKGSQHMGMGKTNLMKGAERKWWWIEGQGYINFLYVTVIQILLMTLRVIRNFYKKNKQG